MLNHNWFTIMADVAATRKMIFDNSDNTEIYRNHRDPPDLSSTRPSIALFDAYSIFDVMALKTSQKMVQTLDPSSVLSCEVCPDTDGMV
jgi:hypothetical protein